jgi:hypothetical protein
MSTTETTIEDRIAAAEAQADGNRDLLHMWEAGFSTIPDWNAWRQLEKLRHATIRARETQAELEARKERPGRF